MNRTLLFTAFCLLLTACGSKPQPPQEMQSIDVNKNLPGDSTRYGLACDGCTDSLLVLLPYEGGDPDTLDIIRAFEEHRLYGRPHVGDKMAVIMNPDSTEEVLMVVNISTLQGRWRYLVSPTLRHLNRPLPDSILQRIMVPREYSLQLRNGGIAISQGAGKPQSTDKMSPVSYPEQKRYQHWHLYNGRLILLSDSTSQQVPDTAVIQLLRRDSLTLRFKDHEQTYYSGNNK